MSEKENILNELHAISPAVAAVPRRNVFSVDDGYFTGIEAELKARITADSFYAAENMFSVPDGYFDTIGAAVLQKIKAEENISVAEEMESLSTLIAGIGNKNVFTVPQGYFENDLMPVSLRTPAKVVKMNPFRAVYKYAAAAVITGLIGISVINIVDRTPVEKSDTQMSAVLKAGTDIAQKGTFDAELNTVSDNEIEQYLQQSGQDVNAALVASVTDDEASLPEATDYLYDENTLDNFLNSNNLKN